jgi:hypothetical protein
MVMTTHPSRDARVGREGRHQTNTLARRKAKKHQTGARARLERVAAYAKAKDKTGSVIHHGVYPSSNQHFPV